MKRLAFLAVTAVILAFGGAALADSKCHPGSKDCTCGSAQCKGTGTSGLTEREMAP